MTKPTPLGALSAKLQLEIDDLKDSLQLDFAGRPIVNEYDTADEIIDCVNGWDSEQDSASFSVGYLAGVENTQRILNSVVRKIADDKENKKAKGN